MTEFGRYRLEALLGQGGMGQVYRAFDTATNRWVAVKVFPEHVGADHQLRQRFMRDANALAGLADPHVIPIHGFGEIDGRLYLDMRLVEGQDLQTVITRRGPLGPEVAVALVEQLASALDSAHRSGLIHGDVNPSNVLVAEQDFAYLMDFDIARPNNEDETTVTRGDVRAFAYTAPERIRTGLSDEASDVYSLACVLAACLAGADSLAVGGPPPRPSTAVSGVPRALDEVVARGMAKDPAQRYRDVQELAVAARGAIAGNAHEPTVVAPAPPVFGSAVAAPVPASHAPRPLPTPAPQPQPAPVAPAYPAGAGYPPPSKPRSKGKLTIIAVVAALVVVVVLSSAVVVISNVVDSEAVSPSVNESSRVAAPELASGIQLDLDGSPAEWNPSDALDPAGDGGASCTNVAIAMAGPLTGPDDDLGANVENGARYAVDRHNAANPDCQVELKVFDTGPDDSEAYEAGIKIGDDPSLIGVVGPLSAADVYSAGLHLERAGVVMVTPSAMEDSLGDEGRSTFLRGVANYTAQTEILSNFLTKTLAADRVCLLNDYSLHGLGIVQSIRETIGSVADPRCDVSLNLGSTDVREVASHVEQVAPDVVFLGGDFPDDSPMIQQLRADGIDATFVVAADVKDPAFLAAAAEATKGTVQTCGCGTASTSFARDYSEAIGEAPGTYSVEAYDIASIMLHGIDSGAHTRDELREFMKSYSGDGEARHYQWTPTGDLVAPSLWAYNYE